MQVGCMHVLFCGRAHLVDAEVDVTGSRCTCIGAAILQCSNTSRAGINVQRPYRFLHYVCTRMRSVTAPMT